MVLTCMRAYFNRLPPKKIIYRNYKNFESQNFLDDLEGQLNFAQEFYGDINYENLSTIFRSIVDIHAPLKEKKVRGNEAPFMNKELSKAIMTRSRLKHKYTKWPSRENFLALKRIKNKCARPFNMAKFAKKQYFKEATSQGIMSSKSFWNAVKPFLTNKGIVTNDIITLEENGQLINDEKEVAEILNDHYINIVENTSGEAPSSIGNSTNQTEDRSTISKIIKTYENHPSIRAIRNNLSNNDTFTFPKATQEEINSIIKSLNPKKATGPDGIPPKIVKLSSNVIDKYLTNIINNDLSQSCFSQNAKIASVRPIYKKNSRTDKKNYRPVSILNAFSKVYERYIHEKVLPFADKFLSLFISAYRKNYSSNHVLLRLIEDWKKHLDRHNVVGAVLMDLSKAFDCIPHDLLIAKLHAYGFDENALTFIYSYLKRREQCVSVNNNKSMFQTLLSGVPQGSILGPLLFNIFLNDLFLFIKRATLHNFADDNTISAFSDNIKSLLEILTEQSNEAVNWFKHNNMIVNPDKFQALIVNRLGKMENSYPIEIQDTFINSQSSVSLLGVEIDNKLNFDQHIATLCKKAGAQINAISRLKTFLGMEERKVLIESFIYSNFNYCPLVWHFCSAASKNKIEKIQERSLRFLYNDYNSTYAELLDKADKPTMEVRRLRNLATEIFKTLNNLNPTFMQEMFIKSSYSARRPNDLFVSRVQSETFGRKSLLSLGPRIWNSLPEHIKEKTSINQFQASMKMWFGEKCFCSICKLTS